MMKAKDYQRLFFLTIIEFIIQIYEEKIRNLFEGEGSIEVKTERDIWADTGNAAIEIKSRGKPSGISTTEAKWWIHVFTIENDVNYRKW